MEALDASKSSMEIEEKAKKRKSRDVVDDDVVDDGDVDNTFVNSRTTHVVIINCVESCKDDVSLLKTRFDSLKYRCTELVVNNFSDFKTAIRGMKRNPFEITMVVLCTYGFSDDYFFFGTSEFVYRNTLYNHLNQLKRNKSDDLILFANVFNRPRTEEHTFVQEEQTYVDNIVSLQLHTYSSPRDGYCLLVRFLLEERFSKTVSDLYRVMMARYYSGPHSTFIHSVGVSHKVFIPSFTKDKTVNSETTRVVVINCLESCKKDVSRLVSKLDSLKYHCTELKVDSFSDLKSAVRNLQQSPFEITMVFLFTRGYDRYYFFIGDSEYTYRTTLYSLLSPLKRNEEDPLVLFVNIFINQLPTSSPQFIEEREKYITNIHTIQLNTYFPEKDDVGPTAEGSYLVRYLLEDDTRCRDGFSPSLHDLSQSMTRKVYKQEKSVGSHQVSHMSYGALYHIFFSIRQT